MKFKSFTSIFILILISLVNPAHGRGVEALELITIEESSILPMPSGYLEAGRNVNDGPIVEVIAPSSGNENSQPVEIIVRFIPKDGRDIDLSTIRVEYLKVFTIDLTPRLKPYTTKDGIRVPGAKLPSGNHVIRLTVGDVTGAVTEQVLNVRVQ